MKNRNLFVRQWKTRFFYGCFSPLLEKCNSEFSFSNLQRRIFNGHTQNSFFKKDAISARSKSKNQRFIFSVFSASSKPFGRSDRNPLFISISPKCLARLHIFFAFRFVQFMCSVRWSARHSYGSFSVPLWFKIWTARFCKAKSILSFCRIIFRRISPCLGEKR